MRLKITGYSLLGAPAPEGIRYSWQTTEKTPIIESAAFLSRAKIQTSDADKTISAYTTSVSGGCILRPANLACKFCRTGQSIKYTGPLTSNEISLQNIFMVMSDIDCKTHHAAKSNLREFAYMGQGEPGFSYSQLRKSIRITNDAMHYLNQNVYRHIIATSGVTDMVDALICDLECNYYNNYRITFHFSLHSIFQRSEIIPINYIYNYKDILCKIKKIYDITNEKICIGIILFKSYSGKSINNYSTTPKEIDEITNILDPQYSRISLCEFNSNDSTGMNMPITQEEAESFVSLIERKGFEVKLFASFGVKENTACGLLGGTLPDNPAGENMLVRYKKAIHLIEDIARSRQ